MSAIQVIVKHQGKRYDVELDPSSTGETFKYQLFSLTGVEPDRQKILVKGGQLKDDTPLSKLNAKAGQTFMMMGTPSAGEGASTLARPKEQVKFMEDMTEAEAAQQEGAIPAGLQNLGNTCYMNSTLQTLRAVPELQQELIKYKPSTSSGPNLSDFTNFANLGGASGSSDLISGLKDLYKQMSETQEGFPPLSFLHVLRQNFPQFAQRARTGNGYAQQDAEEAWSQILTQIRDKVKIDDTTGAQSAAKASFVDRFMAGHFKSEEVCDEPGAAEAGEIPVKSEEDFLKLNCHISKDTNHLKDGILGALNEKREKHSDALGKDAMYTKTSRISRLPKYLTVHFVRFFWKREAQKKAKIMRKVTFPAELDVVDFCTDSLKEFLAPVRDKVREIRKDEEDTERARKRQKRAHQQEADRAEDADKMKEEPLQKKREAEEKKEKSKEEAVSTTAGTAAAEADTVMPDAVFKTDAEYEAERAETLLKAKRELYDLIAKQADGMDESSNRSGLYELRGVVTHQGASADSGHYTAYVRKQGPLLDSKTGRRGAEDGKWWWFNDEKVTEVDAEKIQSLAGGGESHSALILLYRAFELPSAEEVGEKNGASEKMEA